MPSWRDYQQFVNRPHPTKQAYAFFGTSTRKWVFTGWLGRYMRQLMDECPLNGYAQTVYGARVSTGSGYGSSPENAMDQEDFFAAINSSPPNRRYLFKSGDVFDVPADLSLVITANNICLSTWGGSAPARIERVMDVGNNWSFDQGTTYRYNTSGEIPQFVWQRGYEHIPLWKATSLSACRNDTRSWYYDQASSNVFVNIGQNPNGQDVVIGYETANRDGILIRGNNIRIDNLHIYGYGCSPGSATQYWSIRFDPQAHDSTVVVTRCRGMYCGRHSMGILGVTAVTKARMLIYDCETGFCTDSGDGTSDFVGYSTAGTHEFIVAHCRILGGRAPAASLTGGFDAAAGNIYGHGSYTVRPNLFISYCNTITAEPSAHATWSTGCGYYDTAVMQGSYDPFDAGTYSNCDSIIAFNVCDVISCGRSQKNNIAVAGSLFVNNEYHIRGGTDYNIGGTTHVRNCAIIGLYYYQKQESGDTGIWWRIFGDTPGGSGSNGALIDQCTIIYDAPFPETSGTLLLSGVSPTNVLMRNSIIASASTGRARTYNLPNSANNLRYNIYVRISTIESHDQDPSFIDISSWNSSYLNSAIPQGIRTGESPGNMEMDKSGFRRDPARPTRGALSSRKEAGIRVYDDYRYRYSDFSVEIIP